MIELRYKLGVFAVVIFPMHLLRKTLRQHCSHLLYCSWMNHD